MPEFVEPSGKLPKLERDDAAKMAVKEWEDSPFGEEDLVNKKEDLDKKNATPKPRPRRSWRSKMGLGMELTEEDLEKKKEWEEEAWSREGIMATKPKAKPKPKPTIMATKPKSKPMPPPLVAVAEEEAYFNLGAALGHIAELVDSEWEAVAEGDIDVW